MSLRVHGKVGSHPSGYFLIRSRRKLPKSGEWVWIRTESPFGHALLQNGGRWTRALVEDIHDWGRGDGSLGYFVRFSL